jgi:aspartyl protease family protein
MIAVLCLAERIAAEDVPVADVPPVLAEIDQPTYRIMGNRWIEIGPSQYGHYITHATINGTDVTSLIDTGASVVALSYEDALRIGLMPEKLSFNRTVTTANGLARAAAVKLDIVAVEGVAVENVEGLVMHKGAMRGSLLGMSFLRRLSGFRVEQGILHLEQ